jgi:hypothetical protein
MIRMIFDHWAHGRKMFTTLCSMKDNIIVSLCDLRGLCGEKSTFCSEVKSMKVAITPDVAVSVV